MNQQSETAESRQIDVIEQLLTGLRDQLIYVADYMEEHGVMTQEETRKFDLLRQTIQSKIYQINH